MRQSFFNPFHENQLNAMAHATTHVIATPWGPLRALWHGDTLQSLRWTEPTLCHENPAPDSPEMDKSLVCGSGPWQLQHALGDYVSRGRQSSALTALLPQLATDVGTAFQRRVWQGLADVARHNTPTLSYTDLARHLGSPTSVRAVAHAVGQNPWMLVLPCHRVVGADGQLRGYQGGLARKHALLSHENRF